jgi:ribosome-associated protein
VLDTGQICSFADYFVICNGDSNRQIDAIQQEINKTLKVRGILPHHIEGTAESGWILVDLGGVIVHIFAAEQREYYKLEELWDNAAPIIRIQ